MEGDGVGAGLGELGEVMGRVGDHEVTVEDAARRVDHRRDRAEHDRPDRHRRDEVPVSDVEVEDAAPGTEERVDLLTEPGEVGGVERRCDLAPVPDPRRPAHTAILTPLRRQTS